MLTDLAALYPTVEPEDSQNYKEDDCNSSGQVREIFAV